MSQMREDEVRGIPSQSCGDGALPILPPTAQPSASDICDNYRDHRGRVWFCVARYSPPIICCETRDGWKTAASPETFARWDWTRLTDAAEGAPPRTNGQVPGKP